MANFAHIIPFLRRAEGGYVNNTNDEGGETMDGVTWATWQSVFGNTHDRFLAMSNEDWGMIFKKNYWDQMLGDQINSQRISDAVVDWVYNSGKHYPEADVQDILIHSFGQHIGEDGDFGPKTKLAVRENITDNKAFALDYLQARRNFYTSLADAKPKFKQFLKGWLNRCSDLQEFVESA